MEEADAEPFFEKLHVLADHGSGKIKRVGRGRKGAQIGRLDEHGHAGQTIHIENSWFRLSCRKSSLSLLWALA
ncbi:hypothetical protein D3C72_2446830 [compost metagenome]